MTLPSAGALTYSAVQTEFGGSNPISDSEYYAGGANVPSGTTGVNGAVPSSGTLSWSKFYGTSKGFVFSPTLSGDNHNYNVGSRASIAGWNGVIPLFATITIDGSGYVGSTDASAAFIVGSLPAGSTVTILNSGWILGKGGGGGSGNGAGDGGVDGGLALSISYATSIYNYNVVGGGGGGGSVGLNSSTGGGGGGGGGFDVGEAGSGFNDGSAGGRILGGAAGSGDPDPDFPGISGGVGGNLGQDGQSRGVSGGAAGACTSGNSNITWQVVGTRYGALN